MTLSNRMTLPTLRGTLAQASPWQTLIARAGNRIYPFQLGCMVRTDSTGTAVLTHGLGQFIQNNYVLPCRVVYYGDSNLFLPDVSRLTRVTSDPTAAADDTLDISPPRSLVTGEWLMCIGNDTSGTPLSTPNYDGSTISLYTDNVGNNANANPYLLSAQNGEFNGWIEEGFEAVDLLITNGDGEPLIVIPLHPTGPGII